MSNRRFCGNCPNLIMNKSETSCTEYKVDLKLKMSFSGGAGPVPCEGCNYIDPIVKKSPDFKVKVVKNIGKHSKSDVGPVGAILRVKDGDIYDKNGRRNYWYENLPNVGETVFDRVQAYLGVNDEWETIIELHIERSTS